MNSLQNMPKAARALPMILCAAVPICTASAQDDRIITVTGSVLTREEIRRETQDYIRETGIAEGIKPVTRWTSAICPKVIGVSAENATTVRRKIEEVARVAGVKVGSSSCTPNIVVAFALDSRDLMGRLAKKPGRIGDGDIPSRKRLIESDAPVRWWYGSSMTGRFGTSASSGDMPGTEGNSEGGGSSLPVADTIANYNSSIVSTQVARVLTSATVTIDVNRSSGTKLDAIAALAALVVLAEIDPDAKPPGSILSLFPVGSGIDDLSETDRQMLKALYALPLDRTARQHRGRLLQDIVGAKMPDAGRSKTQEAKK
jgi:hypothetical protein